MVECDSTNLCHSFERLAVAVDLSHTSVLQDTLVESNYSREEAEEILARVLSVVDSADHFISQTTTILEDVCRQWIENRHSSVLISHVLSSLSLKP